MKANVQCALYMHYSKNSTSCFRDILENLLAEDVRAVIDSEVSFAEVIWAVTTLR
jgi:hypothetical protein